ncbi:hypothetical protein POM88_051177 [Heracleum sosnowskyi]|uniref:F-box domain-containing protein n=1 Tax=Heracleum sosnowskyi TaxID=360622 RepID=A0AAD8H019_9APIA|nr:hypothetical protein POM88_051177 [Heracleum sosnowskyi]
MQQQKMKKLQRPIPEEIIILILERLPPKSLLRFKCVQKSWNHLIRSPSFVTAHSNCQKKYLLFGAMYREHSYEFDDLYVHSSPLSLRFDEVQCKEYYRIHQQYDEYHKMHPEDADYYSRVLWYAASHGLICYTNDHMEYERDIFLWNPAIRKLKILPSPPRPPGLVLWLALAFGYCQKANDFKVVKILNSQAYKFAKQTIEVEVYSLNTNSWKTINGDNLIHTITVSQHDWVFLNSTAYFRGSNCEAEPTSEYYSTIVSYDTDKDIMKEIPTPETRDNFFFSYRSILVLNDSLVYFTGKPHEHSFNMWVLKQGGDTDKFCWEKKINVNVNLGQVKDSKVLAPRSNGEILLHETSANVLVSYDAEKDDDEDFADSWEKWFEPGRIQLSLRADPFSESLFLINT